MATTLDYALMAGSAYQRNRHEQNWIPAPTGWDELGNSIGYEYDPSSGYEAVAYRNGSEIVIAFAGTDEPKDWAANLALAGAFWTPEQLYKAKRRSSTPASGRRTPRPPSVLPATAWAEVSRR